MISAGKRAIMMRLMRADPRCPYDKTSKITDGALEETYGAMADQMIEIILDGPDSRGLADWTKFSLPIALPSPS